MRHSDNGLCLIFDSNWGSFSINPDEHRENVFTLHIETAGNQPLNLGYYCSISDAISAVANQETGYAEWDQLGAEALPHRVHNIACWKFQKDLGTLSHAACSK